MTLLLPCSPDECTHLVSPPLHVSLHLHYCMFLLDPKEQKYNMQTVSTAGVTVASSALSHSWHTVSAVFVFMYYPVCRSCTLTKLKSLRQKANSGRLKRCTVLLDNMTWPSICTSSTACGTMSCAWCHSTARYVLQPCCFSSSSTLPVLPCLLHPFSLWPSLLLLHDVIRAYFA